VSRVDGFGGNKTWFWGETSKSPGASVSFHSIPSLTRCELAGLQRRAMPTAGRNAPAKIAVSPESWKAVPEVAGRSERRSDLQVAPPRPDRATAFNRLCCKSRFALVIKNSAGCRRGFRVKM
jgi:hypothetical protein